MSRSPVRLALSEGVALLCLCVCFAVPAAAQAPSDGWPPEGDEQVEEGWPSEDDGLDDGWPAEDVPGEDMPGDDSPAEDEQGEPEGDPITDLLDPPLAGDDEDAWQPEEIEIPRRRRAPFRAGSRC